MLNSFNFSYSNLAGEEYGLAKIFALLAESYPKLAELRSILAELLKELADKTIDNRFLQSYHFIKPLISRADA